MTYKEQSFSDNALLTSQQLNQIGENTSKVRNRHKDRSQPAVLEEGILWLDDSVSPFVLKVYTGSEWLEIAKVSDTENTAWMNQGEYSNENDGSPRLEGSNGIQIQLVVTQLTWESVGPTGSGADNIWTDLDDVPEEADWILVRAEILFRDGAGPKSEMQVYACRGGGVRSADTAHLIYLGRVDQPTLSNVGRRDLKEIYIPVDSSNIFDVLWYQPQGANRSVTFYLVGYGFNP